jgi:ATP-dependent DNA helicase RecG
MPLRDRRGLTSARGETHPGDPLTRLKGIGPKSSQALAAEGIHSVGDLLLHLPRRYEDRTRATRIDSSLEVGSWVLVRGRVREVRQRRIPGKRLLIVDGLVDDGLGRLAVVWFNQRWVHRRLAEEPELYLYGQLRESRGGSLQIVNPEIEEVGDEVERVVPVYRRLGRFGGRRLRRLVEQCVEAAPLCPDPLDDLIRKRFDLPQLGESLVELHSPSVPEDERRRLEVLSAFNQGRSRFHRRLAFDELLAFACSMGLRRITRRNSTAPAVDPSVVERHGQRPLVPFELTAAQDRVIRDIASDFNRGVPMARLIQGDVGCGKTVVAAMAMLMTLDSGHQVAFMAPTEVLAEQHGRTFSRLFAGTGYTTDRLTGFLSASEQRRVHEGLRNGSVRLVVGTHALFQESVEFRDLGLVVVDEQHRFGVAQRQALAEKGRTPHLLVMTATPIPRSLALTLYGDLDLSIIDEMPPGRHPVKTHLRFAESRTKVFEFVRSEVREGGRAFVVYPIIDASEDLEAAALTEREAEIRDALCGVEVEVLHGRLDKPSRELAIARFRDGSAQVLLATTVVEVGVDVPEASVMVIESAQRFGLSQLHQLRGRVGRGERQAWCILMADDNLGEDARKRLELMCACDDGFDIAEADLDLRGPGELTGVRQWGPAGFRFANLIRDRDLIKLARNLAAEREAAGDLDDLADALGRYHPVGTGWAGD